jgi:hypothetical protein
LSTTFFPTTDSPNALSGALTLPLIQLGIAKTEPYYQFVGLLTVEAHAGHQFFKVITAESEYTGLVKRITELRARKDKAALVSMLQGLDPWTTSCNFEVKDYLTPILFTCDKHHKHASVKQIEELFTQVDKFEDSLHRTSELLTFIAAFSRSGGILNLGDIFANKTYSWIKLVSYLLDKRELGWGRIRINVEDSEDWDFSYPEIDEATEDAGL